jgi:signal recognition particle receptor subunit beta
MPDNAPRRWDFFISYTAVDRAWAEWIAWELEEAGYQVLVQAWDFVPGSHWTTQMREGIVGAQRTVAIISPHYLTSVYGQAEWEATYRADPKGFTRKLIPVRVEDCPRPDLLAGVVSFDLFGYSPETARDRLLGKISEALAGRAKPATAPAFPGGRAATEPAPPTVVQPPQRVPPPTAPAFPGPVDPPRRRQRRDVEERISSAKILVAGSGTGRDAFIGSVSDIGYLTTELASTPDRRDLGPQPERVPDTVPISFGRIAVNDELVLYLFGTPDQIRLWFLWDDLTEGAIGAVVLLDGERLTDGCASIDYFEHRQLPYLVAVDCSGGGSDSVPDIRDVLQLRPDVPVLPYVVDHRESTKRVLISLVEHAHAVRRARVPASV